MGSGVDGVVRRRELSRGVWRRVGQTADRALSRGPLPLVALLLCTLVLMGGQASEPRAAFALGPEGPFVDVSDDHPYSLAINDLQEHGVISGYVVDQRGEFRPGNPIWRAQFAKMICGALGLDVNEVMEPPFDDLGPDDPGDLYPHEFVASAAAHGITRGVGPGRFSPYTDIRRAQVVTMAVRGLEDVWPEALADPPAGYQGALGDFSPDHGQNVVVAEFNGLLVGLQGYGPDWDPWAPATRGEVAQILWHVFNRGGEGQEEFEEVPAWRMPDLALESLTVEPERVESGTRVTFETLVVNRGTGGASSAAVTFWVDGVRVDEVPVGELEPGATLSVSTPWRGGDPGRHHVVARLTFAPDGFDGADSNDQAEGDVWVAGEERPVPALVWTMEDVDLPGRLEPGGSTELGLRARNPSFAVVRDIPVRLRVDGEAVAEDFIDVLGPGGEQELNVPWRQITPGQHVVTAELGLPDRLPLGDILPVASWQIVVPGATALHTVPGKGAWASLGPRWLTNGSGFVPTGSVGRIDAIAFNPKNPNIAYAGSNTGGIWKTTNGGQSWVPLGDQLQTMTVGAIAVDPVNPQIVYMASGYAWVYGGDIGLFKSIDGGTHWHHFARYYRDPDTLQDRPIRKTNDLIVRRTGAGDGQVVVYVGTGDGVLRYTSGNPSATTAQPTEWQRSKKGWVEDLAVHPADENRVYASILRWVTQAGKQVLVGDGVCRTTTGVTAGETGWTNVTTSGSNPVPIDGRATGPKLDIFAANPNVVYLSTRNPDASTELAIYKSTNGGDDWSQLYSFPKTGAGSLGSLYNPFVRVHPVQEDRVYFGGVGLFRAVRFPPFQLVQEIHGPHADHKDMEFVPGQPWVYWDTNDGGIWKGTSLGSMLVSIDYFVPLNKDLRVTQFYDLDAAAKSSNLMIGGTQDNGTPCYTGSPDWRLIKEGDGNFSIISPTNPLRMYVQHQFLRDTYRTDKGANSVFPPPKTDWTKLGSGLPQGDQWKISSAYFTVDPKDGNHLLSQGDQVYESTDGGDSWQARGPQGVAVKGDVTRVLFQPGLGTSLWVAGTSEGQIWYRQGGAWHKMDEHINNVKVRSMAFAPTDNKVLYVVFDGGRSDWRIVRYEQQSDGGWTISPITGDFPLNVWPLVIAGDPHSDNYVYIGTPTGVYRGDGTGGSWFLWTPYGSGLPLVEIRDLVVDPTSRQLRAATFGRGVWAVVTGP